MNSPLSLHRQWYFITDPRQYQKLTTVSAIVFMLTSLSLGIVGRTESSVIDDFDVPVSSAPAPQAEPAPAVGETGAGGQQDSAGGSGQGSGQDAGQGSGR